MNIKPQKNSRSAIFTKKNQSRHVLFATCTAVRTVPGFTLIELLIVMTVIGTLLTIAYPSYKAYLLKSRRSDALHTLSQDQLILERCYSTNFSYSAACDALPAFPQLSAQGFYSITLSNLGTSTYTLIATPIGPQAQDTPCASIGVNQANVRTATDSSSTSQTVCWNPI